MVYANVYLPVNALFGKRKEKFTLPYTPVILSAVARKKKVPPFGQALLKAREAAGMTQTQVEEALGLLKPTVSQYESAAREPKLSRLLELADLFGISLDELVGRKR